MAGYNITIVGPAQSGKKTLCQRLSSLGFNAKTELNSNQPDAIILTVDLSNAGSIVEMEAMMDQIHDTYESQIPIILCGNKTDMKHRKIMVTDIVSLNNPSIDKRFGIPYFSVSALSGYNLLHVKSALEALIENRSPPDRGCVVVRFDQNIF